MSAGLTHPEIHYAPLGDQVVVARFENTVSIALNRSVRAYAKAIREQDIPGVLEVVITFNTLAVCYDPCRIRYMQLIERLRGAERHISASDDAGGATIHIPVAFGGGFGPDLEPISAQAGLSLEETASAIHAKPYYVYMVGFIAGAPYCGDMDSKLALPRRSNPRLKVPKGSIAIANNQTTIYTIDSPGGWHLVGWTPMEVFNPFRERPGLIRAGDYLQYVPIAAEEAIAWDDQRQRKWDQEWNGLK